MENDRDSHTFFVVRIDSSGFEASLEKHKIYAAFATRRWTPMEISA
jgi:hypothetical protein